MPQITLPKSFRVSIVEYERGWGSKVDQVLYFDDEEEAKKYARNYNAMYNTETTVPDWYMVAQYDGQVT
jgi:hypothetical protein